MCLEVLIGWFEVSATEIRVPTILTPSFPLYFLQYRIQFLALDLVDGKL